MKAITSAHVVFAADGKYAAYAGIAMYSIIKNNPARALHFHILADGIASRDLERLQRLCAKHGAELLVHDAKSTLDVKVQNLKTNKYLSRTTYARLLLDQFLPPDISRVLYLDCDTLCCANLDALWDKLDTIQTIAAAPDSGADTALRKTALGLPDGRAYCNAGMLLINMDTWRKQDIGGRLLRYLHEAPPDKIRYHDQDALNALLWREMDVLPANWNFQFNEMPPAQADVLSRDAAIIHYTGRLKPWQFDGCKGRCAALFRAAKAETPWRWKLPEFRFLLRLRRSVEKQLRKKRGR